MKVGYDHELLSSFYLWFDDRLNYFAEAYATGITQTFQYVDTVDLPSNYNAYYSPYRQLVWASDKTTVPNYVTIDGTDVYDKDNIYIDYSNGRVLLDSSVYPSTTLTITGTFPIKTVNVYITDETEENIILSSDFIISPADKTYLESKGGYSSKLYAVPAVFMTLANSKNEPFAFGGMDQTESRIRCVVVADSNYTLDGIASIFRDAARTTVPLIDYEDFPLGEFSHVKSHPYTYEALSGTSTTHSFIENVNVAKLTDRTQERITSSTDYKIGFLDFDVTKPRVPRQEYKRT